MALPGKHILFFIGIDKFSHKLVYTKYFCESDHNFHYETKSLITLKRQKVVLIHETSFCSKNTF